MVDLMSRAIVCGTAWLASEDITWFCFCCCCNFVASMEEQGLVAPRAFPCCTRALSRRAKRSAAVRGSAGVLICVTSYLTVMPPRSLVVSSDERAVLESVPGVVVVLLVLLLCLFPMVTVFIGAS